MTLQLGKIIATLGGTSGGETTIEDTTLNIPISDIADWVDIGEITVTRQSLVAVIIDFTPKPDTYWAYPTPTIRVLGNAETETKTNSIRGNISPHSTASNDLFSVAGVLPPGDYTISVNPQNTNRSFTVTRLITTQTPTTIESTLE